MNIFSCFTCHFALQRSEVGRLNGRQIWTSAVPPGTMSLGLRDTRQGSQHIAPLEPQLLTRSGVREDRFLHSRA